LIGRSFARGSFTRRIVTRALIAGGAVLVGGHLMRALPHDQILVFPLGSVFPNAVRFDASWQRVHDSEPSGGVTLSFDKGPPLQIRQHASLPDGDYVITLNVVQSRQTSDSSGASEGVQTNIERRVNLMGGETKVALAAGGF
jgi:hypothetical protein